ncbi:MAG TPA: GntR family transcriptional regulator, partial [Bryobacteraceae bacterium]
MRRTQPNGLPAISLDRNAQGSLHVQLFDRLREWILGGAFRAGSSLPSTRALSRTLGVSRNTVL